MSATGRPSVTTRTLPAAARSSKSRALWALEVTLDDCVRDRHGSQPCRNLPGHRRLADTSAPSDEQYLRVIHEGSLPARATSRPSVIR
jgi:hypothetical protein